MAAAVPSLRAILPDQIMPTATATNRTMKIHQTAAVFRRIERMTMLHLRRKKHKAQGF